MTFAFLDFIGEWVIAFINWLLDNITNNYGWAVVLFTIAIKLVLSPLDIWQRASMASNNRKMKKVKPQLEQISKKYANDQQMMYAKQQEIYKKHNIKLMGGCLPMIITLVIFFAVFSGFNTMTRQQAINVYTDVYNTYTEAYETTVGDTEAKTEAGVQAVIDRDDEAPFYSSWLLTKNLFLSDTPWTKCIPDYGTYTGSSIGQLGIKESMFGTDYKGDAIAFNKDTFDTVMQGLNNKYGSQVNGYLILPIVIMAVTFLTQLLTRKSQPQINGGDLAASSGKSTQITMVIMLGAFSLFYSTAFAIYMLVSQLYGIILQVIFGAINNAIEKKEEDRIARTTFKR